MSYRKGPFALYALSEYIGEAQVNGALRRLLETHRRAEAPLATTRDLYRELQAVTPDSLKYLLHDLFEVNTFWDLEAEQVTAEPGDDGSWRVMLNVRARKMVVDEAGVETEVPMNDSVEIGIFDDKGLNEPIYLHKHPISAGKQTITVTVPRKPTRAGIDPNSLLIEVKTDDNVEEATIRG